MSDSVDTNIQSVTTARQRVSKSSSRFVHGARRRKARRSKGASANWLPAPVSELFVHSKVIGIVAGGLLILATLIPVTLPYQEPIVVRGADGAEVMTATPEPLVYHWQGEGLKVSILQLLVGLALIGGSLIGRATSRMWIWLGGSALVLAGATLILSGDAFGLFLIGTTYSPLVTPFLAWLGASFVTMLVGLTLAETAAREREKKRARLLYGLGGAFSLLVMLLPVFEGAHGGSSLLTALFAEDIWEALPATSFALMLFAIHGVIASLALIPNLSWNARLAEMRAAVFVVLIVVSTVLVGAGGDHLDSSLLNPVRGLLWMAALVTSLWLGLTMLLLERSRGGGDLRSRDAAEVLRERLARLEALRGDGTLSADEYAAKRQDIIASAEL